MLYCRCRILRYRVTLYASYTLSDSDVGVTSVHMEEPAHISLPRVCAFHHRNSTICCMSPSMRSSYIAHKRSQTNRKSTMGLSLGPIHKAGNPPACTRHSLVDSRQNGDICLKESPICVRPCGTDAHASRNSEELGNVEAQPLEFTEEVDCPAPHDGIVVTYDVWRTVEESPA